MFGQISLTHRENWLQRVWHWLDLEFNMSFQGLQPGGIPLQEAKELWSQHKHQSLTAPASCKVRFYLQEQDGFPISSKEKYTIESF